MASRPKGRAFCTICEMFRDQVVYGGSVRQDPLVELDAMEPVEFAVLLQDRRDDPLEFSLLSEGFPGTRGCTDLSTKVGAEPSMQTVLELADEVHAEARSADVVEGGTAPEGGGEAGAVEPEPGVRGGCPGQAADEVFLGGDNAREGRIHPILCEPAHVAAVSM